jgi:hypothetical protein
MALQPSLDHDAFQMIVYHHTTERTIRIDEANIFRANVCGDLRSQRRVDRRRFQEDSIPIEQRS